MPQELLTTPLLHQTQCGASVRKIKEILHLKDEAGLSNRAIAGVCKISNRLLESVYVERRQPG